MVEIRNAIRNASGPRPALFVPEASFEVLVRKQIAKLETPAQKCADLVFEELQRLLHRLDRKEHKRFPNLAVKMVEVSSELLRERLEPTLTMIESLVRIEMAYINTNHPDFCRAGASLGVLAKIVEERQYHAARNGNSASFAKSASEDFPLTMDMEPTMDHNSSSGRKEESGFLSYLFRGQQVPSPSSLPNSTHHHQRGGDNRTPNGVGPKGSKSPIKSAPSNRGQSPRFALSGGGMLTPTSPTWTPHWRRPI